MKKLTFALPALALVLASCGSPTPQIDPLTLSFTTTGSADWAPKSSLPLTHVFRSGGAPYTVGTLNPDKTVKMTITPDMVKTANPIPLSNFKNNYEKCTVTGLAAADGVNYYRLTSVNFMDGTTASYLLPGSYTKNTDGTFHWVENEFWYMNQNVALTGTAVCSDSTVDFKLDLKAGWNQVQNTYTYNSTTKQITNDSYRVVNYSNTYSGGWIAFKY